MWDDGLFYSLIGLVIIAALASFKYWGAGFYTITKHWRLASFIVFCCFIAAVGVLKQQEFKYDLAYYYMTGTKYASTHEARYQIRQCKEFVQAKVDGQQTAEYHTVSAGFININNISNWDFCAQTFGMNYWKHDTSINGQDGGRLLCEAYARDTYRSSKVQSWCDTVFAPTTTEAQNQKV